MGGGVSKEETKHGAKAKTFAGGCFFFPFDGCVAIETLGHRQHGKSCASTAARWWS